MQFRDLGAQYRSMKDEMDQAIMGVISSGQYIGGSSVGELEKRLADYVGVRHCVTCANGTDALQLALMAWGIGSGDAVIVPDFTFFSTGEVVSAVGATPVFIDVDCRTFNLDPEKIEGAIDLANRNGLKMRAVIAVDLFGLPADYPTIRALCSKYGLLLLEDGAQGFGGSIGGEKACAFGDVSTTSFFPAKPLGCYGDGGAVFTDNDEWAALIRSFAVHGKGSMKYDNVRVGMNSRLDTIQAAVVLVKLKSFAHELAAVNRVAAQYIDALAGNSLVVPYTPSGYKSSWAQFTIQVPEGVNRDAVQKALREVNIPSMVYYPKPMHRQAAFSQRYMCECAPIADRLCKTVLSLPMSPYISEEEVSFVSREVLRATCS